MENPSINRENQPIVRFSVSKDEFNIYMLAKAGWYGGDVSKIYAAPIDEVIKSYHFEIMARQFKNTSYEMSKKQNENS